MDGLGDGELLVERRLYLGLRRRMVRWSTGGRRLGLGLGRSQMANVNTPAGKADYRWARQVAERRLGSEPVS